MYMYVTVYIYIYITYQCLYHIHSFTSHLPQEFVKINGVFYFQSVHHAIQHDKGTSTAHTSTTMY